MMRALVRKVHKRKSRWCANQLMIATGEIICLAHLNEARAFVCPYSNKQACENAEFPCLDYESAFME